MKYRVTSLAVLLSVLITACSQSNTSPATAKPVAGAKNSGNHYQKPGAPLSMTSTYKGDTEIGEEDNFSINITTRAAGDLTVTIRSQDNLLAEGDRAVFEAVAAGETLSIPVTVSVSEDGKYYLKIVASLNSNGQSSSRAFGIAIYAGDWKTHSSTGNQKHQAVDGVIMLPAKETIITQ